ncbi:MAG: sigma-70 family RNA polymerase sigma factor [Burkholderiales bacterium]|nr:MAG: sigma-70 family RNA polymerase sigma factor [Burkholderiales bacterium]
MFGTSSPARGDAQSDRLLEWIPRLRRYARALVANKDEADDLVQDTLERAWARLDMWDGVRDMRAWLFSVMHNLHIDAVRRKRIDTVDMDDETPEIPVAANQDGRRSLHDLEQALAKLPTDQREVLLLVGLEDMSYAEVAATLDIPIGTVMSRLSRGRERLRALMEGRREPPTRLRVV